MKVFVFRLLKLDIKRKKKQAHTTKLFIFIFNLFQPFNIVAH